MLVKSSKNASLAASPHRMYRSTAANAEWKASATPIISYDHRAMGRCHQNGNTQRRVRSCTCSAAAQRLSLPVGTSVGSCCIEMHDVSRAIDWQSKRGRMRCLFPRLVTSLAGVERRQNRTSVKDKIPWPCLRMCSG